MNGKFKLTALERNWILYDIGNSAFTLLVSTLIPIYFNSLAGSAGVNEDMYLSYWGYAGSISTILVAFIAPICGTLSDRRFKKPIFLLTVLLGCIACAALGITTHWLWFLGIFVLARSASTPLWCSTIPCCRRSPPTSAWTMSLPWAMPSVTSVPSFPL